MHGALRHRSGTGEINPNEVKNLPGLEALDKADLMFIMTRFRDLPDEQMQHIVDYLSAGKPVIGIRTATHAFKMKADKTFAKFSFDSKTSGFEKGFGRQVLGETWVNHHGATVRKAPAPVAPGEESNPMLRGIKSGDIWVPTDVYSVNRPFPAIATRSYWGRSSKACRRTPSRSKREEQPDAPDRLEQNLQPFRRLRAKPGRAFCTTMGSSQDLENEGFRRLLANAAYWCLGMENKIPEKNNVDLVGAYHATPFKAKVFKRASSPPTCGEFGHGKCSRKAQRCKEFTQFGWP